VQTDSRRLSNIHIVAAISSKGRSWYVVGSGNNNSNTFLFFLLRLCKLLEDEATDWRSKVRMQLDNAAYHRSNATMGVISSCCIPTFFQGPYSFRSAPVEMVFGQVKKQDLLPDENQP
jgi:transposase